MGDYKGSFDSIEEAVKEGRKYQWYDIAVIENGQLIEITHLNEEH